MTSCGLLSSLKTGISWLWLDFDLLVEFVVVGSISVGMSFVKSMVPESPGRRGQNGKMG